MEVVRSPGFFLVAAFFGCASSTEAGRVVPDEDVRANPKTESGASAPEEPRLSEEVGVFQRRGATPVIVVGHVIFAVVGERLGELREGARYKFALTRADGQIDGFSVRRLVDFRPVKRLIGTLSDTSAPDIVQLTTLHAKSYLLFGDSVASFHEVRANLPAHDYTRTLFRVSAVEERTANGRVEWLDYEAIPLFGCTDKLRPGVRLDLVNVQPDDSLLDGFVTSFLGAEAQVGAHAECRREGAEYKCLLDDFSGPWGTTRFVPREDTTFEVVIERTDRTKVEFVCATPNRASLTRESED